MIGTVIPIEILNGPYDVTGTDRRSRHRVHLFVDSSPPIPDGVPGHGEPVIDGVESVSVPPQRLVIMHDDRDHVGDGDDAIVERVDPETWVAEETPLGAAVEPALCVTHGTHIRRSEAVHVPGNARNTDADVDADADVRVTGGRRRRRCLPRAPTGYFTLAPNSLDRDRAEDSLGLDFDVGLVSNDSFGTADAHDVPDRYVNHP